MGVEPTLKKEPLAGPEVRAAVNPGQLSPAEGMAYVAEAPHCPDSAFTVTFGGQRIVGACASETTTEKLQLAVTPFAAVTRNTLTVEPTGKNDPETCPET